VADIFRRHDEAWREANVGHVSAGELRGAATPAELAAGTAAAAG
jgi:hypothetical protein